MSYRYYLGFSLVGIFAVSYIFSATTYFDVETVSAYSGVNEVACIQLLPSIDKLAPISISSIVPAQVMKKTDVYTVPFYSQFTDISAPEWRGVGCGIASLAMLIEFYEPNQVSVDDLLKEGIANNAFLSDAGWIHSGLINLSRKFGLEGESYSLADSSMETAFIELESVLEDGPVMASVHYTFDPQNPIPHLVVVNGVFDGKVYYNDPAEKTGGGSISITKFQSAWKKRYIEIRPIS